MRRIDHMPLADLVAAPANPKRHNIEAIGRSIERFAFVDPLLLDERTGRLVAGHGRLAALRSAETQHSSPPDGIEIDASGRWMVPVVRGWSSRSDADAAAYLLADNRLSEIGGWDEAEVSALLESIGDPDLIDITGWDPADLEASITEIPAEPIPESPVISGTGQDPVTRPGDVWIIGGHRVMCGDATNPDHIDTALAGRVPDIIHTDPPYGISAVPKDGGASRIGDTPASVYRPVAGDDSPALASDTYRWAGAAYPDAAQIWWGANHYAGTAQLRDATCWLVWDKNNGGNDFADAELAWTNVKGPVRLLQHTWNGMIRASELGPRVHPTQKPVVVVDWALGVADRAQKREMVLDMFGGSGSTLVAADMSGRRSVTIELDPWYVDVICRRAQEATGLVPVLESTGAAVDFTTPTSS
jgi:hypothetical protein